MLERKKFITCEVYPTQLIQAEDGKLVFSFPMIVKVDNSKTIKKSKEIIWRKAQNECKEKGAGLLLVEAKFQFRL